MKKITKIKRIKNYIRGRWNERYCYKYYLVVSHQRAGNHFLNYLMEAYLDRPRFLSGGISPLGKERKDWLWIAHHDFKMRIINKISKLKNYKFKKIIYLYRDPLDTIFSLIKMNVRNPEENVFHDYTTEEEGFSDKYVIEHFNHLKKHNKIYLNSPLVIPIKYENLLNDKIRNKEFKKICDFFGYEFDEDKLSKIFNQLENKHLSGWTGPRSNKQEREKFKNKWKDKLK